MISKDEIINKIRIRQDRAVSTMKNYDAMKDKKKLVVLPKVIRSVYHKNPGMQEAIDVSVTKLCAEEGVSPEQVFFILLFSLS